MATCDECGGEFDHRGGDDEDTGICDLCVHYLLADTRAALKALTEAATAPFRDGIVPAYFCCRRGLERDSNHISDCRDGRFVMAVYDALRVLSTPPRG